MGLGGEVADLVEEDGVQPGADGGPIGRESGDDERQMESDGSLKTATSVAALVAEFRSEKEGDETVEDQDRRQRPGLSIRRHLLRTQLVLQFLLPPTWLSC